MWGACMRRAGNIADADFLAANNLFTDNTGIVQNNGLIRGNEVHLVGQNVVNAEGRSRRAAFRG